MVMSSSFDQDMAARPLQIGRLPEASALTAQCDPPSPEMSSDQDGEAAMASVERVTDKGPATHAEAVTTDVSAAATSSMHELSITPLVTEEIDEEMELTLVHAVPPKPPTQEDMQLPTRKLYVRTSARLLSTLEPLRHLVGQRSAQFTLLDEGVPLEAVGAALEWLAVGDAAEREELLESLPDWRALLGVLAAASWLGQPCHALHQACEARLRPEVCLEHVLALAIAADKCDTLLV